MGNFNTLRNIIILLMVFFVTGCRSTNSQYSSSDDVRTISSEDTYTAVTQVGDIVDPESGHTIRVVAKK